MKIAKFGFSLFGINTYVVWDPDSRECAVIDPGMICEEEFDALYNFIDREGLTVTHLINTHLHIDHAIADNAVVKKYGVQLEAHVLDAPLGLGLESQSSMFSLGLPVQDVVVNQYLTDEEVIKIGGGELQVLHVPGHSPGSIVLYDKEDGFAVVGDVLFQGSIGRTDLPGGSMTQLLTGIHSKLMSLPGDTVIYPGHGPATTIDNERKTNPFLR